MTHLINKAIFVSSVKPEFGVLFRRDNAIPQRDLYKQKIYIVGYQSKLKELKCGLLHFMKKYKLAYLIKGIFWGCVFSS